MGWLNNNINLAIAERFISDLERTTPSERRNVVCWARRMAQAKRGADKRPYEAILLAIHEAKDRLPNDYHPTASQMERFLA